MNFYKIYDLVFASTLDIPYFEGVRMEFSETYDVSIQFGEFSNILPNSRKNGVLYQLGHQSFQLNVDGIAKYRVLNGKEINIFMEDNAEIEAVTSFLLDAPISALLHQRGLLPIYGAALKIEDKCVLICGISGNGKSTHAREFIKRGYKILTDDLAVVSQKDGYLNILTGYPSQRLPVDEVISAGLNKNDYKQVRNGINQLVVPIPHDYWHDSSLPLKKVYVLTTWNENSVEFKELEENDLKFNLLHDSFHRQYLSGMGSGFSLVKITVSLMSKIPAAQILSTRSTSEIEIIMDLLEEDFKK